MGMNPETNKFEMLKEQDVLEKLEETYRNAADQYRTGLIRPDGSPVPKTWTVFSIDEEIVIKGYTFRVAYIGETAILFEPVGVPEIGKGIRDAMEGE